MDGVVPSHEITIKVIQPKHVTCYTCNMLYLCTTSKSCCVYHQRAIKTEGFTPVLVLFTERKQNFLRSLVQR